MPSETYSADEPDPSPITSAFLREFRKDEGRGIFVFQIGGNDEAFWAALRLLKRRIPATLRSFDEETKEWTVRRDPLTERALKEIFLNGAQVIIQVDSQLRLPLL